MTKLKSYPEYKSSGIEWIGDVPTGWEVKPLKYNTKLIIDGTHFTPTYIADGIAFLRVTDISSLSSSASQINWDTVARIPLQEHRELSQRCFVEKGDLLVSKNGTIGIPKIVDWDIPVSIFVSLCLIKPNNYLPSSLYYYFKSFLPQTEIALGGKTGTITNLHLEMIKEFKIPSPPLLEQQAIADFLDRETAHIDTVITKKTRLIELLKEKRQATITHAVTKGLNPQAKMKDSGIEWIGEVPEEWKMVKLRTLCNKIGSGKTPSGGAQVYIESGVCFLRSQNIHDDGLRLQDVAYISNEIDCELANSRVEQGDILLNITGASIGRSCIVPPNFPPANVNQHVCIIRLTISEYRNFITLFMKSSSIKCYVDILQTGAGREGLNFEQIGNFRVPLPPLHEQQAIAEYLDKQCAAIDTIITKTQRSIELLKEKRQALITAAVTGQIDVRSC